MRLATYLGVVSPSQNNWAPFHKNWWLPLRWPSNLQFLLIVFSLMVLPKSAQSDSLFATFFGVALRFFNSRFTRFKSSMENFLFFPLFSSSDGMQIFRYFPFTLFTWTFFSETWVKQNRSVKQIWYQTPMFFLQECFDYWSTPIWMAKTHCGNKCLVWYVRNFHFENTFVGNCHKFAVNIEIGVWRFQGNFKHRFLPLIDQPLKFACFEKVNKIKDWSIISLIVI